MLYIYVYIYIYIYIYAASQADLGTGALLLELLQCRDSSLTLSNDNFDKGDIAAMIEVLCTG